MIRFTSRRTKIFLSYRRGDTAGHVGRLYDDLVRVFGADRVFMDVDGLHPGDEFITVLRQRLAESAVVLVAIGTRWAGDRPDGMRRIDLTDDFVRLEVATALADPRTRVIPVLCDGASMPTDLILPPSLASLARRQSFELSDGRWRHDVHALFGAVTPSVPMAGRAKRWLVRTSLSLGLLALLVGAGAYVVRTWPAPSNAEVRNVQSARASNARTAQPTAMPTAMPTAPPRRVLPPRLVGTAAEQLARARREWVDDAVVSSISVECDSGRDGVCPLRLRFSSTSRFSTLDASRPAPDSSWSYRQRGGVSRTPALSLEILAFERILESARAAGMNGELDRAVLEPVQLSNGTMAPRWTIWPRDRATAGREGRLCFEPQSGVHVECRSGQPTM